MDPSAVITVGVASGLVESSIRIASPVPVWVILTTSVDELAWKIAEPNTLSEPVIPKDPVIRADPVNGNGGTTFKAWDAVVANDELVANDAVIA